MEIAPDTLLKLQHVQRKLLHDFKTTCEKHNLKYSIHAGTLLGAARHKGFIPWDDDVDVCMPREDYEKYIALNKAEFGTGNFLMNYHDEPRFVNIFARLCKRGTVAIQEHWKNARFEQAIFIDVFPLDPLPDSIETVKEQTRKIEYIFKIKRVKVLSTVVSKQKNRMVRNILYIFVKLFLYVVFLPIPMSYLSKRQEAISNTGLQSDNMASYAEGVFETITGSLYNMDDFIDQVELEFDGEMYKAPRRYKELLTLQYGDYMSLPSEENRKPGHSFSKISFGE